MKKQIQILARMKRKGELIHCCYECKISIDVKEKSSEVPQKTENRTII
jgi:hypothetical protein